MSHFNLFYYKWKNPGQFLRILVLRKKKSSFLTANLHSNPDVAIDLQPLTVLEKLTCLYFLVEFPYSLEGGYSNSRKMNQFCISAYSSINHWISEINKAEFVL